MMLYRRSPRTSPSPPLKHVRRLTLAKLETLAVEIAALGQRKRKLGLLIVKRQAGQGQATPRLIVLTEAAWQAVAGANLTHLDCARGGAHGENRDRADHQPAEEERGTD